MGKRTTAELSGGAGGGVVAPGAPTPAFGALNRPDMRQESLEQYMFRRIDPNHFAALDREKQLLFEQKKRQQISERARRARSSKDEPPLFSAQDPRSWAQEIRRTEAL